MKRRRIIQIVAAVMIVAAIAVMLVVVTGVDAIAPGSSQPAPGLPTPANTAVVRSTTQPVSHRAVGTVESKLSSTVSPRIQGQVLAVLVEAGDRVEPDQVLVRLQSEELQHRLAQARNGLESARAEAEAARQSYERVEKLYAQEAATETRLEQARARHRKAAAAVEVAQNQIAEAEAVAGYTDVRSGMAGMVTRRLVDPGDLAWPGKPLIELHDPQRLRLEAELREGLIDRVALDDKLEVTFGSLGSSVHGTVEEILPYADPRSRSFAVRVALPQIAGLHPGMFGRLHVPLEERSGVVVDRRAIERVGQLATIRVRGEDGVWRRRYVTLGARRGEQVEILSGLTAGETIGWDDT
ncbi:MAG: efflux RND transporter periplasmic adaptor subunit [Planctomycetota bacterium]